MSALPDFKSDSAQDGMHGNPDFKSDLPKGSANPVADCLNAAAPVPESWPLPVPLPDTLPPVQPFHADLMPQSLRGWVMDIARRMQCPPDFPAVGAIVAASSLIGARAVMQPKARDDWQVAPNLWGQIVGRPGVMKSPALAEALKPLERLQADENERYQSERQAWDVDSQVNELQTASRKKKAAEAILKNNDADAARALLAQTDDTPQPVARRFIVNDATVERLGELLTENPWGLLTYRDELYGLLTSMDKQGQEGARDFYLQGYDGNKGYTFDRIGRGTTHIPRVCLAMIGGIQPGRLQEYIRAAVTGGGADDGLLQRFGLTVWPDVAGQFLNVDNWPNPDAKDAAWTVYQRLAALQPASDTDAQVWRFDAAAQALFNQWRGPFEQELRDGQLHPALESHLAKYRKLIPALALIFALIDTPEAGVIGEPELRRALAWGQYLRSHAQRMYSAATTPETGSASALLGKIKAGALGEAFTPREAAQKHWAWLASPDAVRKAADVLIEYDWLRREVAESGARGRRPGERYTVNPAALNGADEISNRPENSAKGPDTDATKATKTNYVAFVASPEGTSPEIQEGSSQPPTPPAQPAGDPPPASPPGPESTGDIDPADDRELF
jgi:putative DNA primase/helicase